MILLYQIFFWKIQYLQKIKKIWVTNPIFLSINPNYFINLLLHQFYETQAFYYLQHMDNF